jgi:hypothetical protein
MSVCTHVPVRLSQCVSVCVSECVCMFWLLVSVVDDAGEGRYALTRQEIEVYKGCGCGDVFFLLFFFLFFLLNPSSVELYDDKSGAADAMTVETLQPPGLGKREREEVLASWLGGFV